VGGKEASPLPAVEEMKIEQGTGGDAVPARLSADVGPGRKGMKTITTIWVAACLFMVIALVSSAITVVPGKGPWLSAVTAVAALLSMTTGFSGIALGVLYKRRPESPVFRSKKLLGALIGGVFLLALVLTLATGG
jgi:hypothetical protein